MSAPCGFRHAVMGLLLRLLPLIAPTHGAEINVDLASFFEDSHRPK